MKIFNELLQWSAIGALFFLLLGVDFDFVAEAPSKFNDMDRSSSEQKARISNIESRISDIESNLEKVATLNGIEGVEEAVASVKAEAAKLGLNVSEQVASVSKIEAKNSIKLPPARKYSDKEKGAELYKSYKIEILFVLQGLILIIAYLIYNNSRLRRSKPKLAKITELNKKYTSESSSHERDCA